MAEPPDEFIGYLKYDGAQVADGIIDARAASIALEGFDSSLRYFLEREDRNIAGQSLPIPVRIDRGSWIAFIPENPGAWLLAALGAGAVIYASTAAKKLAEHDFKDVGLTTLFRKSLTALQWCIRIGKHIGDFTLRKLPGVTWENNNTEVQLPNIRGEILVVPREYFQLFLSTPRNLLKGIARVVDVERGMKLGRKKENGEVDEVEITQSEKYIFVLEDETDSDVLFPELKHGERVTLDGLVTKGNEKENSIGFEYQEHVLTCYPRDGSIVRFKPHLFLHCRIHGEIDRSTEHGDVNANRPKIIFDTLRILNPDQPELGLF
jgi:hypothetical protein